MEWKKENTDMEELNRKQKEYIDEAMRMMKRAESLHTGSCNIKSEETIPEVDSEKDECSENTYPEAEAVCSDECEEKEEKEEEKECCEEKEYCEEMNEADENEEAVETEEEFCGITDEDEAKTDTEEANEPEGDYGVYTAEEILSGEGFVNAEKIIDEIKQQKNAMKKITEEQEAAEAQRTCPKCGKTIDGRT